MADSPCNKKLRYSEPDLKIILKFSEPEDDFQFTDKDNDNASEKEKVYSMYAPNIARLSNFIDASLSVEMKEKALREIVFHDVTPDLFEKALNFLQNPIASRSMTLDNAFEVLPFYDKYEFVGGLELCDAILSEYIENNQAKYFNLLVKTTVAGHKYNLPKTTLKGCDCLNANVLEEKSENLLKAAALTIDHIKELQSTFHEGLLSLPDGIEKEDVGDSPLFPMCLAKCMSSLFFERCRLSSYYISLHGGGSIIMPSQNRFSFDNGIWLSTHHARIRIWKGRDGKHDWKISQGSSLDLWSCPNSKSLPVPPTGPWKPASSTAQGTCPLVTYE